MIVNCIWEHNNNDTLLYARDYPGAYTRGESVEIALSKMQFEIISYLKWCNKNAPKNLIPKIIQEKKSEINIADADTDVLFESEKDSFSIEEYLVLKKLVLKSSKDFLALYNSIPDKNQSCLPTRQTFYGDVPRTAYEMYEHTKNVNDYYFGEIGINADNIGTIIECRTKGFRLLESTNGYLDNKIFCGSYNEQWSLRKVMRRFIWHDRIHAKAMYRMAVKTFGENSIINPFYFA